MVRVGSTGDVRAFARSTTSRLGVLGEHWHGRGRPLNQSRLLHELGDGPVPLAHLRSRLGLDSGYASRLVHALVAEGLARLRVDPDGDARTRTVELTDDGATEVDALDALSDAWASQLLAPLDERRRARLVAAMDEVRLLLDAAAVEVVDADPGSDEVLTAQQRYADELAARFPAGFDPGDLSRDQDRYRSPHGACVVALLDDRVIGTAALAPLDPPDGDDVATPLREVKRMWVDASARGLGVGRRLLDAIEDRARQLGTATLRLDTNEALTAALGLYAAAGYVPIDRYNDNPYATHFLERSLSG